jgi:hypothetical protein
MATLPSLRDPCGIHFTYRDFVRCGETWQRLEREAPGSVPNLPEQPETYAAMGELCEKVLDPVVWAFEQPVALTYAFASPELTRHIPARINPARDQHASHELNARGTPICSRLGFAVDFHIRGISTADVALFIADGTEFDRLYYYGEDRPLHVSIGPERKGQIVQMIAGPSGKVVPRVIAKQKFVEMLGG